MEGWNILSEGIQRAGIVKSVRVRDYENEAKFLVVEIKNLTTLPKAQWQSSSDDSLHVEEFSIVMPLDAQVRVGDLCHTTVIIDAPFTEAQRFRPALEVGEPIEDDDVLEVMVEEGMKDDG